MGNNTPGHVDGSRRQARHEGLRVVRAQRHGGTVKAAHAHGDGRSLTHTTPGTEQQQLQPLGQAPRTTGPDQNGSGSDSRAPAQQMAELWVVSIERAQASLSGAERRPLL